MFGLTKETTSTLTVREAIDDDKKLPDAIESLDVAIALGAEVSAPVGSSLYAVHVQSLKDDDERGLRGYTLSVHQNYEDALESLATWCLKRWRQTQTAPWLSKWHYGLSDDYNEKERVYVASHNSHQAISDFFYHGEAHYEIIRMKVEKAEQPLFTYVEFESEGR